LVKRGNFRDERGAQPTCLFIVAAFEIGHACRETIPGALDLRDRIVIVDLPGGFERRRPEKYLAWKLGVSLFSP
jgi:hypothetical protein